MREIPEQVKQTLFAIERATAEGQLYPLDALDTKTGEPVFVLCAKVPVPGTVDDVDMVPLAVIIEEPPHLRYAASNETGEGYRPLPGVVH